MDYSLAKKLKDAGFPQSGENVEANPYGEGCVSKMITETDGITDPEVLDKMRLPGPTFLAFTDIKISDKGIIPVHPVYVPTLSELIEACGDGFFLEKENQERWIAISNAKQKAVHGSTPEEAVTLLYLALPQTTKKRKSNETTNEKDN